MDVLIPGGTGFVGSQLCREVLERGHSVTALTRSPGGDDLPDGVSTVTGDVTDADSLEGPIENHDVIINLVDLSPLYQPQGITYEDVVLAGTSTLLEVAERHGIELYVQMSNHGADPTTDIAQLRANGRAESLVRESTLDTVIFRPSLIFGTGAEIFSFLRTFTTPYLTGLPSGGSTPFQPIWRGDITAMIAEVIDDPDLWNSTFEIGGPEVLTLSDMTKILYRSDGKSVRILPIPMALVTLMLSIADPIPKIPFGRDQARSLRVDNTVENNDITAFGRTEDDLLRMEAFLDRSEDSQPETVSPLRGQG